MKRRAFLRAGAVVAGATTLGVGGGVAATQPQARWWVGPSMPPGPRRWAEAHPQTPAPKVVVVGGGLAGLSTATTLATRGFQVTLLEQAPHLGGKVGAWTTDVLGTSRTVEHGFHGYFHQYTTLRSLLQEAGALTSASFAPANSYPIAFADRPTETFGTQTTLFPLNLLDVIRTSPSLRWREFRHGAPLLELCRYDGEATYQRFDGVDFATWCRESRVPPSMFDLILRPFGETTLNRLEHLSTAEAFKFFHIYFAGAPTGLGFDVGLRDSHTAVVGPLAARAQSLGVEIRTSAPVASLAVDGDRVTGVVLRHSSSASRRRVPLPILAPTEQENHEATGTTGAMACPATGTCMVEGVPYWVDRAAGVATDLRCTHQGCPVAPTFSAPATGSGPGPLAGDGVTLTGFSCPCHGGRFDRAGVPVAGPPRAPLARVAIVDGALEVPDDQGGEVLSCDAVVVACDTRGTRGILERSGLDGRLDLAALAEAEPFSVVRYWLDRAPKPERPAFFTAARFRYLDSLALYSHFQEDAIAFARETGGSVIEAHAYAIADEDLVDVETLADRLYAEALMVLPELRDARVLHREAQLQRTFSRFAPGDHAHRLGTTNDVIENLLFAGDWVRIAPPAALMEGAVISGRLAANALLARAALPPEPFQTVDWAGPLVWRPSTTPRREQASRPANAMVGTAGE